jgi:5-oxoprolinase (ATP-hydrolysing) subunit A
MIAAIDLNADLGEGFGPWTMGQDAALLAVVSSANIACGGHAGDPDTMFATLAEARRRGVAVGAHPGYADLAGFGRRIIPMTAGAIERMVAAQIGALTGVAALAGVGVGYVKPHGALANLAADDPDVAAAIARAVRAVSRDLAVLAISGTALEPAAQDAGLAVFSEIFADRAYRPDGRLVPRSDPGAVLHDPGEVTARMLGFVQSGRMPVQGGGDIALAAHSVCVHGDSPGAVALARGLKAALEKAGIPVAAFRRGGA